MNWFSKTLLSLCLICGVSVQAFADTHNHDHKHDHEKHKHDHEKHEHNHKDHDDDHDKHDHDHNEHDHEHSHGAHVHGSGKAFIIQDNLMWQIELVLPAGDVLGFETVAETSVQENTINRWGKVFEQQSHHVVNFPNCESQSVSHNLNDFRQSNSNALESDHNDVKVTFVFECSSAPTYLQMTLFKLRENLENIDAQIIYEKGQTAFEFTARQSRFELN